MANGNGLDHRMGNQRNYLMTAPEYKSARETLGITQAALAEKLGVTRRTIISRESGARITVEAALAIRALVAAAR